MADVLLIEDDDLHAELIASVLPRDVAVRRVRTLHEARAAVANQPMEAVLLDYTLPDGDGLVFLEEMQRIDPDVPVIVVTATNDARTGIAALRAGAREYVVKDDSYLQGLPLVLQNVLRTVRLEAEHHTLRAEVSRQRSELSVLRRQNARGRRIALVGTSAAMERLRRSIQQAARSAETVLVLGETGSGKELVARAIHEASERRAAPFVAVNCAAVPETLLEAQFFGFTKGAFTGAQRDTAGLFETAGRGTLLLDEIGDLPRALQSKLLRVLQEREFVPLGGREPRRFHGRLVAATNVDPEVAVQSGAFRADLYYRLNVVPIVVPPLRERREDIPMLVEHFVAQYNQRNDTRFPQFSARDVGMLMRASWPGNVRELENLITRVLVMAESDDVEEVRIPDVLQQEFDRATFGNEQGTLLDALERNRWNRNLAAAELGISRSTLWRKMSRCRLLCEPGRGVTRVPRGPRGT